MGKNKDGAKRTKGNTKPSSSARSADLLNTHTGSIDGHLPRGIVTNSSLPVLGLGGISGLGDESAEDALPNELKQTMRKMSKKDSTTKLKALQEFIDFVNENSRSTNNLESNSNENGIEPDLESIKASLPFWPRLYCKLSNDNDRRVREYAHKAHLKLSTTVGRELAPYLRAIAAAWFLGRYDCHPPAASAANQAFNAVFPSKSNNDLTEGSTKKNKHREAIIFCGNEILNAIRENLINVIPLTSGDSKSIDEEQLSRYNRLVATSLNAYASFWQELAELQPRNDDNTKDTRCEGNAPKMETWNQLSKAFEKTKEIQASILNEGKFWKYSQSKESAIRSAWYNLLCTICTHCFKPRQEESEETKCTAKVEVLILNEKHIEKIASATLGRLDDISDAVVTSRIWDTSLHLVSKCKDWPSLIDVDKRVLPKVFAALEKPKYTSVLYPSVIPLISRLPKIQRQDQISSTNRIDTDDFFKTLLHSFRKGAEKELGFLKHSSETNSNQNSSSASIKRYGVHANVLKSCVQTYFECIFYYSRVTGKSVEDVSIEPIDENAIFRQAIQWIDDLTLARMEKMFMPEISPAETEISNDESDLTENKLISNVINESNYYSSDMTHETIMIQGYCRFVNGIDRTHFNNENKKEKVDNLIENARNTFWEHLMDMCTKLRRLSASNPQALKLLQVILSALYEAPKGENCNSVTSNASKSSRKLRFADNDPEDIGGVKTTDLTQSSSGGIMNLEFRKIVNELAVDSLLVVLKASFGLNVRGTIDNLCTSTHYSDQLKFITGLLKQQNHTSTFDRFTFYKELWKGITNFFDGNGGMPLGKMPSGMELKVAESSVEIQAICDILNTLISINIASNKYLQDEPVQRQYIDLYLTIIEALPVKNRALHISADLQKVYQLEKSVASTKSNFSPLDWMILIICQIVGLTSQKHSMVCLQDMMQSCDGNCKDISFIIEDLADHIFGNATEDNNATQTEEEKRTKLLKLLIKHLGSVLPQDCIDRILVSLLTKFKYAVNYCQFKTVNHCKETNIDLVTQVTNAINVTVELVKQLPNFWKANSKESRLELLTTLFKLSTFDALNLGENLRKALNQCWEKGLKDVSYSICNSSKEDEAQKQINEELIHFIQKRISDLSCNIDDVYQKKNNIDSSIDLLASQVWKYIHCFYEDSLNDSLDKREQCCWRTILHDILHTNTFCNEERIDRDNILLMTGRVEITSLPNSFYRNGVELNGHGKSLGTGIKMNLAVCRFLLKIFTNMFIVDTKEGHHSIAEDLFSEECSYEVSNKMFENYADMVVFDFIESLSFIELAIHTNGDSNIAQNANDLLSLANLILAKSGGMFQNLINKSMELSATHGWEYALCLEHLLTTLQKTPDLLNRTKNANAKNLAEKFAKQFCILPYDDDSIKPSEGDSNSLQNIDIKFDEIKLQTSTIEKKKPEKSAEGSIHSTITLIKFLDRNHISTILMTEIGRILSLDPLGDFPPKIQTSPSTENEEDINLSYHDQLKTIIGSSFCLVNACLKRVSFLPDAKEARLLEDEKIALKALLQLIWNWRQNFEQDFLFSSNIFDNVQDTTSTKVQNNNRINRVNDKINFVVSIIEFLELSVRHLTTRSHNGYREEIQVNVEENPTFVLEASHWDLILCALSSWTQSIEESGFTTLFKTEVNLLDNETKDASSDIHRKQVLARNFGKAISKLTITVSRWIYCLSQNVNNKHSEKNLSTKEPKDQSTDVIEEWQNFFAEGIYSVILNTFVALATYFPNYLKSRDGKNIDQISKAIISQLLVAFGQAVKTIPDEKLIEAHGLPAKFNTQDVITCSPDQLALPDKIVFLLNHLCPLLTSPERSIQITTFHLLAQTMTKIAEHETGRCSKELENQSNPDKTNSEDNAEEYRELPKRLAETLEKMESVLNILFKECDLSFGEPLPIPFPIGSAAYSSTLTYLLTWRLIIAIIENVSGDDLRPKYSEYLRRGGHLETLMMVLFHTMIPPLEKTQMHVSLKHQNENAFREFHDLIDNTNHAPLIKRNCSSPTKDTPGQDSIIEREFDLPTLNYQSCEINDTSLEIQALARNIYYAMLKYLPALVRNWWNMSDKRTANIVEKYTISKVAPSLWYEEVHRINGVSVNTFDNMTIKVRSSVREVVAIYTLGDDGSEGSMELVIQLPANFPLGAVQVESGKRVGVTTSQWRTWMLQLTTFLQHQNGSIVDGLTVWKRNVDKRFQGVEECYICFYVLHGTNHQLPKLACRTCKKKFHAACLYKWFSTSNNSTCPLCRNLF